MRQHMSVVRICHNQSNFQCSTIVSYVVNIWPRLNIDEVIIFIFEQKNMD